MKNEPRNKFEMGVFKELKALSREENYDVSYESERVPYTVPARSYSYIPDFIVEFASGHKRYIETKGYLRPEDKVKMRLVKRSNPDLDIRILFYSNNRLPRSKMRYSDWAEKYGFPYAIKVIPKEWFSE